MWLLTEEGKREGAYAVQDGAGDKVLYIFEQEDDAIRYADMLEEDQDKDMDVVEIDEEVAIKACEVYNYKYSVISKNDFVIPPKKDDSVQKN
tara:strand:+ start:1100 stop:1375 length:276 start_codon:yes stop_codon:yes gene_type:complete